MNAHAVDPPAAAAMVQPFPEGGRLLRLAYRELAIAAQGNEDQVAALGPLSELPRPWDPATCRRSDLRVQLWAWLELVVRWLNREYVWDVSTMIPACWPQHPHLVREIALLADQRRRAGAALSSDAMEEWSRYALPAFSDRMRSRLKDHCEEGHQVWPARSRYVRQLGAQSVGDRQRVYDADARTTARGQKTDEITHQNSTRRVSVDLDTGEISDNLDTR
ncbi:hypothetical protein [Allobranchiibius sp. CTAmp26]|uniref:hypothetical protein n=1 Tax=Allobranchiibius sp. CTAmp26 TaxID=2815214 RepID=UPI001AA1497F|nr:hypothetical protein [Allobranchiibius sp. CTAmp26]MBO1756479.1 hypothetical protein [Allobranchiibius sp. CTAmp26]